MKKNLAFLLLLFCTGCSVKPEQLKYATDNCYFCKMTLMDDKFGAELVTTKGKVFKFDDIKCMVSFLKSAEGKANEYAFEMVTDYAHPDDANELIAATEAHYCFSESVKSPMGGNVAAFKNETDRVNYLKKSNGSKLDWNEVKEDFQ
ncbi:MAG: nitrous oxide reductase accessory protein NosL [Bacteroidetes bacterium]|nr:nitrous oxide reductase accessory protein NosL [Bacteroidota bacterium]